MTRRHRVAAWFAIVGCGLWAGCSGSSSTDVQPGNDAGGSGGQVVDSGQGGTTNDGAAGATVDATPEAKADTNTVPEAAPDVACVDQWQDCSNASCCAGLMCVDVGLAKGCAPDVIDGGGCLNTGGDCSASSSKCCDGTHCSTTALGSYCVWDAPEAGTCVDNFGSCSAPTAQCCSGLTCYDVLGQKRCGPTIGDGGLSLDGLP
jgi:hypothetical protein